MAYLSDYVSEAMRRGYSEKELRELFSRKGYTQKEIDNAFTVALGKSIDKKSGESKNNVSYMDKFKMIFSAPSEFFSTVREANIGHSIALYLIIAVIMAVVKYGTYYYFARFALFSIFGYLGGFLGLFGLSVISFISLFIYSGIAHGIVKLFGGRGNYVDTFNIIAYSSVPALILSAIPLVGYLAFIYTIVLGTIGISIQHDISKGKAVASLLLPGAILLVILIIILISVLISVF